MAVRLPLEAPHFIEQVEDISVVLQGYAPLDKVVPVEDEVARGRGAAEDGEHVGVPAIGEAIGEKLRGGVWIRGGGECYALRLDEIVLG